MSGTLIFAIIAISLALVFYTIGVFAERKAGILEKKHVIIFWIGLLFDTLGTTTMAKIAASGTIQLSEAAKLTHSITGVLAILLMLFHATWATWVLNKGSEKTKEFFHKFSIVVWIIWLIPYFVGMYIGMVH